VSADSSTYLLDTNVLIAAHRSYYAFDICPGFWESVKNGHQNGRVFSTQRVKGELLRSKDPLTSWIQNELPPEFFIDDSSATIASEFGPMMAWVMANDFLPAAKTKFATDADGWLIAAAKTTNICLVTHEAKQTGAKARVPMPNVCEEFGVKYCNTFDMLRALKCQFA